MYPAPSCSRGFSKGEKTGIEHAPPNCPLPFLGDKIQDFRASLTLLSPPLSSPQYLVSKSTELALEFLPCAHLFNHFLGDQVLRILRLPVKRSSRRPWVALMPRPQHLRPNRWLEPATQTAEGRSSRGEWEGCPPKNGDGWGALWGGRLEHGFLLFI